VLEASPAVSNASSGGVYSVTSYASFIQFKDDGKLANFEREIQCLYIVILASKRCHVFREYKLNLQLPFFSDL